MIFLILHIISITITFCLISSKYFLQDLKSKPFRQMIRLVNGNCFNGKITKRKVNLWDYKAVLQNRKRIKLLNVRLNQFLLYVIFIQESAWSVTETILRLAILLSPKSNLSHSRCLTKGGLELSNISIWCKTFKSLILALFRWRTFQIFLSHSYSRYSVICICTTLASCFRLHDSQTSLRCNANTLMVAKNRSMFVSLVRFLSLVIVLHLICKSSFPRVRHHWKSNCLVFSSPTPYHPKP